MKEIELTQGKVALVDDADFERVSAFKWYAYQSLRVPSLWYATRGGKDRLSLHRFILPTPKGFVVDHIDGDGLNCQRKNLRACTVKENMRNQRPHRDSTSPYKGIWRIAGAATWAVQIWNGRKRNYVGSFRDPAEAAKVYDFVARQVFGPFARLNFPEVSR